MEGLQIAQILADLSDLQNTEPSAATALLSAHRVSPNQRRSSTISSLISPQSPSASQPKNNAKHDRLGRLIIRPTPSLPRASSSSSNLTDSQNLAAPGPSETDEDLQRARTLLELFEQRGRFKQMGDTGLLRSKERVDVVAARYATRNLEEKEKQLRAKRLGGDL